MSGKKNRTEKEMARLRAEVEALKAELKSKKEEKREYLPLTKKSSTAVATAAAETKGSFSENEAGVFLKNDLRRTLLLTLLSLFLILSLKATLSRQKEINHSLLKIGSLLSHVLPNRGQR